MRQILERHLLVGNEFSIANLTEQGRDNYLQTIRGKVKITIVESGGGKRSFRIDFIQIFRRILMRTPRPGGPWNDSMAIGIIDMLRFHFDFILNLNFISKKSVNINFINYSFAIDQSN